MRCLNIRLQHMRDTHDANTGLLRWSSYVQGTELSSGSHIGFQRGYQGESHVMVDMVSTMVSVATVVPSLLVQPAASEYY